MKKIAIAQINPIIGDFKYNFRKINSYINRAVELSCDLVVFSEMTVTGYPPRDLLERENFVNANIACLKKLIDSVKGIGVICGFVDKAAEGSDLLYNSAVLFEDGNILHKVNKRLLPTYDVFDEKRYFKAGVESRAFFYKGYKIGLTVCEDAWNDKEIFKEKRLYKTDPVALMIEDGADLIINISASPFYKGKNEFRSKLLGTIAKKYKTPMIYTNQVGGNDSILFDGISSGFDKNGNIIVRASDFKEDLVVFNLESLKKDIHPIAESDDESILKALIMGTRDYVSKCGFSKAVIGLSGGIDSALTAYIAVKALGPENVLTVFMPSEYTSEDNYEDTKKFAENMRVKLINVPIGGIFKEFLKYFSSSNKNQGRAAEPGITEQNIQARIRGTILMGFSNMNGCLLLSTGNKSELGVGYCTLYGDMNGGLAVISDVPKTRVYGISRYINRKKEYIPLRIIEKEPTAELKPDQKDQDDLPPYEVLDPVLKGYIEDFKGVEELVRSGFERELVEDVVSRVDRNEYKRHQAAPGLKVTSKAFGYGRRYPIAQRYTINPSVFES